MTGVPAIPRHWDSVRWAWWAAVLLVLADLGGLALARFQLGWHISGTRTNAVDDTAANAIVGSWSLVTRALLFAVFFFACRSRGIPREAYGLVVSDIGPRARRFAIDAAVLVGLVVLVGIASVVVLRVAGHPEYIQCPGSATPDFVVVFVVALPPVEEAIYRGVVHGTMRTHMGPAGGVFVGGLLFGLLHWFYGIHLEWVWVYALGGMALAFLYERTGSLLFPWIAHVAVNLTASVLDRHQALFAWLRGDP
jgi:hypothetical protein